MRQRIDRIFELHSVSPSIGWKLVDTLYGQDTSYIVSAGAFSAIGVMAYIGTHALWYLAGTGLAASVGLMRFWQSCLYKRSRETCSAVGWVWRSAFGSWAAAAGWGAWSLTLLLERNMAIVAIVGATQGACVLGGVVRYGAIPVIGAGQTYLALVPLAVVMLVSGNPYFQVFSLFTLGQIAASLALGRSIRRQTLILLLQTEEKSELLDRLEVANHRLEALNQELETLAATDALTGIANRRAFDAAFEREWHRAARDQTPMGLLIIDVDHFKAYNDHYGHPAGDACLRDVADVIQSVLRRPNDIAARYGGEEFAVILPATEDRGTAHIAERIRRALALRNLPHVASVFRFVTISIGAVSLFPQSNGSVADMIALADAALYAAKRDGRNRVRMTAFPPELNAISAVNPCYGSSSA